jgi:hypothetical protein
VAQYVSEKVSDLFVFIFFRILHRYVSNKYQYRIRIQVSDTLRCGLKYPCFIGGSIILQIHLGKGSLTGYPHIFSSSHYLMTAYL